MKSLVLILLVFGFTANGQENPNTAVDVYGCWILELSETGGQRAKRIYVRCEESVSKLIVPSSKISLFALYKSEPKETVPFAAPPIQLEEHGNMTEQIEL